MTGYDDIRHLSRPRYPDLPPMSVHDRAAQFAPFAALVGYEDAVEEGALGNLKDMSSSISSEILLISF